jgi:hypothetical protein
MHQAVIKKYRAYQPRDSFEGLPPIEDEACLKWVWKMIRDKSYGTGKRRVARIQSL